MTRNERKRAAIAKRMMLEAAVKDAFRIDAARKAAKAARLVALKEIAGTAYAPGDVKGARFISKVRTHSVPNREATTPEHVIREMEAAKARHFTA